MIAERCAPPRPGAKLNAPCETCGHTIAAHTTARRCDVCDVMLYLLAVIDRRLPAR